MAIDAKCPFCDKGYRLKDDLVGKKVTCANQGCRKVFTVTPSVNGTANGSAHTPAPAVKAAAPAGKPAPASPPPASKSVPPISSEDVAAAALSDDPDEVPEDQKTITMKCTICDHEWSVGWAMQGKNVLCPDCKHRQKVPLQAKGKTGGWRETHVPEGAKQEKLDDVVSARDNKMVSGSTLIQTNAIKIDYDDLPTSVYVKWAAVIGVPVLLIAAGVLFMLNRRTTDGETKIVLNARDTLVAEELAPLPLYRAALQIAYGEYESRNQHDLKEGNPRDKAVEFFRGALADLNAAPKSADREQLYGELAVAWLNLGGDGEDLIEKRKLAWLPPQQGGRGAKLNVPAAELEGVQGQLRRVLDGLRESKADLDVRTALLRRLTRELLKVNQVEVVRSTLPALFSPGEQYEAEAQIGMECFRGNKPDLAREIADRLKKSLTGTPNPPPSPAPASAVALWAALDIKPPTLVPTPTADDSRWAATALNLLKGNREEAKTAAFRTGNKTEPRLRALALAAEWSDKPGDVLDLAEKAVKGRESNDVIRDEAVLLRLAQMSGRAGNDAQAEEFVKAIGGDLKPFAKAEVLRNKLAANPGQQPKDDDAELPAELDAKKLKLGHAWGRLALARHNGARDRSLATTYSKTWPAKTIAPFGQIGVLLGDQDRKR